MVILDPGQVKMKTSGIYKIQSKCKPGRIYIGSSINIEKRRRMHLRALRDGNHHSKKLQSHYNKYGKDDLVLIVLLSCEKEELVKQEQFFIDALNPWFNCSPTAGSPLGVKRSEETKKILREIFTGRKTGPLSDEHKVKLRIANLNKTFSDETRRKISEAIRGKKMTEEQRRKQSERNKKMGIKPPSPKGRIVSEETRRKLSEANKGQVPWCAGKKLPPLTDEHKRKLRETHKGPRPWRKGKKLSPHTDETKKKMSESQLKRGPRSDAFRQKIRDSWVIRKQNKRLCA